VKKTTQEFSALERENYRIPKGRREAKKQLKRRTLKVDDLAKWGGVVF